MSENSVFESGVFSTMNTSVGPMPARSIWFHTMRNRLSVIWSAVSVLFAAGWALAGHPHLPLITQLWIVAAGIGLFGVVHGGLDHIVGERVFKPVFKRNWLIYFALTYVGQAIAVMVGWWLAAPAMLLLFLVASILHFGLREAPAAEQKINVPPRLATAAASLALGAAPIMIPWLAFPEDVALLFGWLAGTRAETWHPAIYFGEIASSISTLVWPFIAGTVILMLYRNSKRLLDIVALMEFLATILLFWTLPPLLAFAWYFCFLHSLRHLMALAERLAPSREWGAVGWVMLRGLPLTVLTLIAATAGYLWLHRFDMAEAESVTKVIFWGLAALTFPHMLLTWWWERSSKSGAQ
jgi:beta-carotene 15,15'-dioxygenase